MGRFALLRLEDGFAERIANASKLPWWKPLDPVLSRMLEEKNSDQNRRIVRWGMRAAVLSYIAYGLFDIYLFPDIGLHLALTRLLVGLLFLTLLEIGAVRGASLRTLHLLSALALVSGGVGWLAVALSTDHQMVLANFVIFGTVFVLGANLFFNFRFSLSAVTSTLVTICFSGATLFLIDTDFATRFVAAFYFVNSLCLSLYLSWRLSLERYHTFLHELQAKVQEQVAIEKGQKLAEIAHTDTLTGLKNRRAISRDFLDMRGDWISQHNQIGIILIDVDFFKKFNDRLGHNAGDDCLIQLAETFAETAKRNGAIVGRYGGEEFVVLCRTTGTTELADLAALFCRAVEDLSIAHPSRGDGRGIVTISAGASLTRDDGSTELEVLLGEADRALYAAKFAGRGTYRVFDPELIDEDISSESLTELLGTAISSGHVSLVYQPIQDLRSGEVVGYETLMRLRDFDGSPVPPSVFIPLAEQTGCIVELGKWAIERACKDMLAHGLGEFVSVNVSAVQLKSPAFPLQIAEILDRNGLSVDKLALEITEGLDIFVDAQAHKNLEQLRRLGVRIWLDDFGTGYAGLEWLRRFEFDVIKIDRAFLNDCQTAQGLSMLEDMVRLISNRNLEVLVEGVETEEQLALLQRLSVDLVQGYLLGAPSPVEKLFPPSSALVA